MGVRLCSPGTGPEETVSNFTKGSFRWVTGRNFFTKNVVKHRNKLPREVVESPALEVFSRCVKVALVDMV